EKLVHRAQEALRLIKSKGALATQIGLQIGHQESGGDAFSGDIADDEAEAAAAKIEEVVVVTADFASLDAKARVLKRFERRLSLRAFASRLAKSAVTTTTSSRSEEQTSELQSRGHLVCRLLLEKKK